MVVSPDWGLGGNEQKGTGEVLGCCSYTDLGAGCTGEFCLCKSIKLYRYGRCSLMHVYYTPRK